MGVRELGQWVVTFAIVGAFIAVIGLCVNATGALDVYRAQQATRQAAAEAARLQAARDLALAQAEIETAQGERAILEAAARAVDSDRRLVTWYTLRGDVRGVLALIALVGLTVCAAILTVLVKGVGDGNPDADE